MARRVFIVGGAHTAYIGKGHPDFVWKRHPDFNKRENPRLRDYLVQVVADASASAEVPIAAVERAWIGNFVGELFVNQGHMGACLAGAHPDLADKPIMRVEGACASGGLAMICGIDAIRSGTDVALIAGVEVQTTASARVGGDYLARASDYARQRGIDDFTFPALFAARTKAYRTAFGVSEEDIGHAAVKAYQNANANPLAHMKARQVDLAFASAASDRNPNFLTNEELSPWLKVTDCSQVSDGASALFLVSEEGLARLGKREADAIEIVSYGHSTASIYEDGDPTRLDNTASAAAKAYAAAGLGPGDVQIAEVHDCFTVTELMMTEALGLADPGRGADLIKDGVSTRQGRLPVNPGGGLVGFGHPVGATGVKQPLEIFRQMKGLCGDYQVGNAPSVGLSANMGGDDKTTVVGLYRNLD